MSADYSTEKFDAMSRDELLAVVKRLLYECVPAVMHGIVHSGLEDAVKVFAGIVPREKPVSRPTKNVDVEYRDRYVLLKSVDDYLKSVEKHTGLIAEKYGHQTPKSVTPVQGDHETETQAALERAWDRMAVIQSGPCPDCKGTGVYRGLLEEKPCPTCQKVSE